MAWDSKENSLIRMMRLRLSAPDVAYAALKEYGEHVAAQSWVFGDTELEKALAERHDRLIDLGLAQFAASSEVVGALYKLASEGTADADFDRAIRLAVLSNRATTGVLYAKYVSGASEEVVRLIERGDENELQALLSNPIHRSLLESLYKGAGSFAGLEDVKWAKLVRLSESNPGLSINDDSDDGPDLTSLGIHRALWDLVRTAPLKGHWVRVLHAVLAKVNPRRVRSPDSVKSVLDALSRWETVKVPGYKDGEEAEGHYSSMTLTEEFRVLVAVLYGRAFVEGKFAYIGSATDPDPVKRCAHYGHAEMKVEEMQSAFERDGMAFVLAALYNDSVYRRRECRASLEGMIGYQTQWIYASRCKQMADEYPWFRVHPVSEELAEQEARDKPPQMADAAQVAGLAGQVTALQKAVDALRKMVSWGLVAVAALVWWVRA
jgi:hypothetical protein